MRHRYFILFTFLFCSHVVISQCDVSVDVPADITICSEDDVNLDGIINGTASCFNWTSDHGYFNNTDQSPFVFVDQNTTFTFLAFGSLPAANLIVNGDFEAGDDGSFTTDYTQASPNCIHSKGFLGCEGFYEIMDDPSDGHDDFSSCTPMGSLHMVVNGAQSLQQIWCQEVDVTENRKYQFSAWAQSVHPTAPAQLQFSIDGTQIGSILGLSGGTCSWEEIIEFWLAPVTSTIEICVTNQNTADEGNDFAIDDLFFGELCNDEMEFTVTVGDLEIDPDLPNEFDCNTLDMELSLGAFSSFTPLTYDWASPDFNIINDDTDGNAFIFSPGTYFVTVTDALGCSIEHFFDVDADIDVPEINLDPIDPILLCSDSFVAINNDADQFSYDYYWEWDGSFYTDQNILEAGDPGEYTVTVTDVNNGCTATSSIIVGIDANAPEIEATFSNAIDCDNSTSQLILNTPDILVTVEWYNADGNIIPDLTVSEGGFYSVIAEGLNGCTANDFIDIPTLDFNPQPLFNLPTVINCNNPTSLLTVDNINNLNLDWSGPNLLAQSGNDLVVSEAGNYDLIISDNNGCSASYTVEIIEDLIEPNIELDPIGILDCGITSIPINISNYQVTNQYTWVLPNTTVLAGPSITASNPGMYSLSVISPNGCSTDSIITLVPSGNLPSLTLSANAIDCNSISSDLTANGTYTTLTWSDNTGIITDLIVEDEGWYVAHADNGNGCDVMDSIYVSIDTIAPSISIDAINLDCINPNAVLSNVQNDDYNYLWTLPDGSTSLEDTIIVDAEGNYDVLVSSSNGCTALDSVQVNSTIDEPTFDVSGIEPLTCINPSISLSIDAPSTLQSIILTNEQGIQQASPLTIDQPGDYVIDVIGSNGCPNSYEFQIVIDTLIEENIVVINNINCFNNLGDISVTNPNSDYIYEWTDGPTTSFGTSYESATETTVQLTTTDQNSGCFIEESFTIIIDTLLPTLNYNVGFISCTQQEQQIHITPNGIYQYEWELPNGDITFEEIQIARDTGDYVLIVTGENGCTNEYLINVTGNVVLPIFDVIQPAPLDCNNATTTIAVSTTELLTSYTGINNGFAIGFGIGELVTDQPGEWAVQATGTNGCTDTVNFIIEVDTISPNPIIDIQNINCMDTTGTLSISNPELGAAYLWEDNNGNPIQALSFNPTDESPVALFVTGSNGCSSTLFPNISIDTVSHQFQLVTDVITCNDPLATIQISAPVDSIEYNWFLGPNFIEENNAIQSSTPGTYIVNAINSVNQCTSVQTIELLQEEMPTDFQFNLIEPPCGEEEFYINEFIIEGGEGPYFYNLNLEQEEWTSEDITATLLEGENIIQVQDINGCILDTIIQLSLPSPVEAEIEDNLVITWGIDTTLNLTINKPLEEIASILWTPAEGLSCTDCLNPRVTLFEPQEYEIQVIDIAGCEITVEIRIEVIKNLSVYVPNVFTPENQDNNLFYPHATEQHIKMVDNFYIFDRWGNRIFSNSNFLPNDPSAGWDGRIADGEAVPGVYAYIMEIIYSDGSTKLLSGDVTLIR